MTTRNCLDAQITILWSLCPASASGISGVDFTGTSSCAKDDTLQSNETFLGIQEGMRLRTIPWYATWPTSSGDKALYAEITAYQAHPRRGHDKPSIASLYTSVSLTESRNKPVAISGIAQNLKGFTKDQYYAGLSRHELEESLCWRTNEPHAGLLSYRAPTWSWASIDGQVCLPTLSYDPHEVTRQYIEVINVQVMASVDSHQPIRRSFRRCVET